MIRFTFILKFDREKPQTKLIDDESYSSAKSRIEGITQTYNNKNQRSI